MRRYFPLLLGLILVSPCAATVTEPEATSVAIITLDDKSATKNASALLEAQLSAQDGVRLVERDRIKALMSERQLALTLSSDAAAWRDLSNVIKADMFVLVANQSSQESGNVLLLRFIESRTGVVLRGAATDAAALEASIDVLAEETRLAVAQMRVPDDQRVYVAFLGLRSDTPSRVVDQQARTLSAIVHARLAANPAVTLLEREQMRLLTQEKTLSGILLNLKASGLILRGGMKPGEKDGQMIVTLSAQRLDGVTTTDSVAADMTDRAGAALAVTNLAARMGNVSAPGQAVPDVEREAERLDALSRRFFEYATNEYNQLWRRQSEQSPNPEILLDALSFSEAAYALDPRDIYLTQLISVNQWITLPRVHSPPSIDAMTQYQAALRTAELLIVRDRERIKAGQINDKTFTSGSTREMAFYTFDKPDEDHPDYSTLRELWEQAIRLQRERMELLASIAAMCSPAARDHFHGKVALAADCFTTSPQEYCSLAIEHHRLSDAAYAERGTGQEHIEEPIPPMSRAVDNYFYGVGYPGDLSEYEPYLQFLESHENICVRYYGWMTRNKADETSRPQLFQKFFDAVLDPASELNRHIDKLEANGHHVQVEGNSFLTPLLGLQRQVGIEQVYALWLDKLMALEGTGDAYLILRWSDWTEQILRTANWIGPQEKSELLDRLERICAADTKPQHKINREVIARAVAMARNSLAKNKLPDLDPWQMYDIEWHPLKTTQASFGKRAEREAAYHRGAVDVTRGVESTLDEIALQRTIPGEQHMPGYLLLMHETRYERIDGEDYVKYQLVRVSPNLQNTTTICRFVQPLDDGPVLQAETPSKIEATRDCMIFGTNTRGLVIIDAEGPHWYDETSGAPSNQITNVHAVGNRVYVTCPGVLAVFNLDTRRFHTIASAKSTERRSPLDDCDPYDIRAITHDPQRPHQLWFTVAPSGHSRFPHGIWRYDAIDGTLRHAQPVPEIEKSAHRIGLGYLAWREGNLLSTSSSWYNYAVERDRLKVAPFDYKSLPRSRRQMYYRLDQSDDYVMLGDHLLSQGKIYAPDGNSYWSPLYRFNLVCRWPSGDRFTAVGDGGFFIITRKPETEKNKARQVTLWVRDDDANRVPTVYIHGDAPRTVAQESFGKYLSRFEFDLQDDDIVVLDVEDTKTGTTGFWMSGVDGKLLGYSRAGLLVRPVRIASKTEYEAQPPRDKWEAARAISTWNRQRDQLRKVAGAPAAIPSDFSGIWLPSTTTGHCSIIVYPTQP